MTCRQVNSLSNLSDVFGVKACVFDLRFSYTTRGLRGFIEWGIMNFSNFMTERGKGLGVSQPILY